MPSSPLEHAPRAEEGRSGCFSRLDRIHRRGDFQIIRKEGFRFHSKHFVWFFRLRGEAEAEASARRLGLAISRRSGAAVRRNRIKRLLRETFRLQRERLPLLCDVLVSGKSGLPSLSLAEVLAEFLKVQAQLRAALSSSSSSSRQAKAASTAPLRR